MANEKQALAINGGTPAIQGSLPVRGHFGAAEKAAADRVMDEAIQNGVAPGYGGPEEDALCKEFAELLGGGYADARWIRSPSLRSLSARSPIRAE